MAKELQVFSEKKELTSLNSGERGLFYLENDIIAFGNAHFAHMFSSEVPDIIGTSIFEWITPNDRITITKGLKELKEGREHFSCNINIDEKQSPFTFLKLKVEYRSDSNIGISGIIKNNVESPLEREQKRYHSLFENAVACIMIYNYDIEEVVDCNKAAIKLMKYDSKKDMLGITRSDFVPKSSPNFPGLNLHKLTDDHAEKIKKGIAFNTPGSFLTKCGKEVLVQASLTPTFYKYGEGFIIFHDVTNEVIAKKAKRNSEYKYKKIFDNLHEAVVYLNISNNEIILCNDNALKLYDVESLDEFKLIGPNDYIYDKYNSGFDPEEIVQESYKKAIANGKAPIGFWSKRKDGTEIRIEGLLVSDHSNPKEPKIIAFLRDVTFMHKAQKALNEKNNQLKKYIDSNMQLENFAYLASHDLQTPLRSIISFTQLLERKLGSKLNSSEKEYLGHIVDSGKNMRLLINDLLSYSRINTSKINLTTINTQKLIQQINTNLSSDIKKSNAKITTHNLPNEITADSTKIQQVFQNLLINAIKFAKENTTPEIIINCEEKKDFWKFSIQDNGIGIEKEYQDKIFLLFKKLHVITKYEGTGIGLAMVKKIVEQHEGKIWLTSKLNQGTIFYFTIKKMLLERE